MTLTSTPLAPPTPRQRLVLAAFVARGGKEAARRLGISPTTLDDTLAALRARYGVPSTLAVVYIATREGWLTVPDLDEL